MICSASSFFPRGVEYPPLVLTTPDYLSGRGAVKGGQVTADPGILQSLSCRCCESQRLVEFSIRKQTSVAGYLAPHQERQLQSTVAIDPPVTRLAVTQWVPLQKSRNWQEVPELQGSCSKPVPIEEGLSGKCGCIEHRQNLSLRCFGAPRPAVLQRRERQHRC